MQAEVATQQRAMPAAHWTLLLQFACEQSSDAGQRRRARQTRVQQQQQEASQQLQLHSQAPRSPTAGTLAWPVDPAQALLSLLILWGSQPVLQPQQPVRGTVRLAEAVQQARSRRHSLFVPVAVDAETQAQVEEAQEAGVSQAEARRDRS